MNSFISWIGGKKLLRNKILEQFPESYERYIEVFGGAGWVLFAKDSHAKLEVYNDINSELVNLYRCVKYHPEAIQKELDGILMSREIFFDAIEKKGGMTDIQRAANFFIAIKESFASDCHTFGVRPKDMIKATDFLAIASKRLRMTIIENVDFERLIKIYDRPGALFYCDPPYYNAEKYYSDRFDISDHIRLRDTLLKIKGKFILSYNDCDEIRKLYEGCTIISTERQDNIAARTESRMYKELIIKNY